MKSAPVYAVEFQVPSGDEDNLLETIPLLLGFSPVFHTDTQTGRTKGMFYLRRRSQWTQRKKQQLLQLLAESVGLSIRPQKHIPAIRIKRVKAEDWEHSWKKNFRPVEIGGVLRIQGTWMRRRPRQGQAVVWIDPGLSFGTGQHPTTAYCLKEIVRYRPVRGKTAMLDAGTGSGILALSAARMGFSPVMAVEIDPVAVRMARRAARLNRMNRAVRFVCADLSSLNLKPGAYGLICANLTAESLRQNRRFFSKSIPPGGHLVMAGVLKSEFAALQALFERAGFLLERTDLKKEWMSGTFSKKF